MKLGSIGEFGFIERFSPVFLKNIPKGSLGIGDDCAVIPVSDLGTEDFGKAGVKADTAVSSALDAEILKNKAVSASGKCLIVTTDLLLENVHFLKDKISAKELGYKSLAVNLSDIAGMGGQPLFAFLSLALPKDTEVKWTDDFFKGFNSLAEETGTFLMGGDTTSSKEGLVINIAVIGKAELSKVKYRSGAEPGDFICVTAMTGESAAGLWVILNNYDSEKDFLKQLVKSHNTPRPHIKEGLFLGQEKGVHAMMDVSDGIDSDLRHIIKKSSVSAEINLDSVPISKSLKKAEKELGIDPYLLSLSGGEDYCLLLTVDPDNYKDINRRFKNKFKRDLYKIGEIKKQHKEEGGQIVYLKNGKVSELGRRGFDHFRN